MNKLFLVPILTLALFACRTNPLKKPIKDGGACSYEKTIDTFTIDSIVKVDSIPYFVLGKNGEKNLRQMSFVSIYNKLPSDTILYSNPEFYLNKSIIIHEQHILSGACNPYGLNKIEIQ